ncbi:adenylyl-sulfate kinase [Duganella sp. FT109W]|uniref:Adenylyl-sulfate kinase n=2 Tax=Duganella margarita TaxID=2692170 RepID=A0ABW9WJ21_9BURK|nr:adenylyl-sulfate kinase [Duganella margarita]
MQTDVLQSPTSHVTAASRAKLHGHRGAVLWLTGLSGSGKTTLAHAVEMRLHHERYRTYVLDGDLLRGGLNVDLGFSDEDRSENIRRAGELAKLFLDAGTIVFCAFISPFASDRQSVRAQIGADTFFEVYCRCPLEVCEQRDVKGLYQRVRDGTLAQFTGISSSYEPPSCPDVVIDTDRTSVPAAVDQVMALLRDRGLLRLTAL